MRSTYNFNLKQAKAAWDALSAEQKKKYEDEYVTQKAEYDEEIKKFRQTDAWKTQQCH